MGGGVSVDQSSVSVDSAPSNIKPASKLVLGDKHWKEELRLYKLEPVIIMLEKLGCHTNEDVENLPNHMWNEIKLKLKLLDKRRFNKLREKFEIQQQINSAEVSREKSLSSNNSVSNSTPSNSDGTVTNRKKLIISIPSTTVQNDIDNEDFGVDMPVYPELSASYDVIVKQMVLIKDDLQHINNLMGCGKYVTVIPYCLTNGLIHSKQLLLERLERCKARRAVLEVAKAVERRRSLVGSPPKSIGGVTSPNNRSVGGVTPPSIRNTTGSGRNPTFFRSGSNSSRCLTPASPVSPADGAVTSMNTDTNGAVTSVNTGTNIPLKNRTLNKQESSVSLELSISVSVTVTRSQGTPAPPKTVTFEEGVKVSCGKGTATLMNYFNKSRLTRQSSF